MPAQTGADEGKFLDGSSSFLVSPPPLAVDAAARRSQRAFFLFFLSLAVTIGDFKDLSFETFQPLSGPFAHGQS